jgi:hypothetical protein
MKERWANILSKKRPDLKPHLFGLLKMSHIELDEILNNIRNLGESHATLIKVLLESENVYTRNGRLNRSSLSRTLGLKAKEIDDMFYQCQKEFVRQ